MKTKKLLEEGNIDFVSILYLELSKAIPITDLGGL
jgi:hypothetical protein